MKNKALNAIGYALMVLISYKAIRSAALIAIPGLMGCAGPETHYTFLVSRDASVEEVESVLMASDEWNKCGVVSTEDKLSSGTDEGIKIAKTESLGKLVGLTVEKNYKATNIFYVHTTFDSLTLAHEMGHAMGLEHAPGLGIMNAQAGAGSTTVTEQDCEALRNR